jgi:hypothetical protein
MAQNSIIGVLVPVATTFAGVGLGVVATLFLQRRARRRIQKQTALTVGNEWLITGEAVHKSKNRLIMVGMRSPGGQLISVDTNYSTENMPPSRNIFNMMSDPLVNLSERAVIAATKIASSLDTLDTQFADAKAGLPYKEDEVRDIGFNLEIACLKALGVISLELRDVFADAYGETWKIPAELKARIGNLIFDPT